MKKITYLCDNTPDHFTLHALFSKITQNAIKFENINAYSEPPHYKIWMEDRCIFIILEDKYFNEEALVSYEFNHHHSKIRLKLIKFEEINPSGENEKFKFKNGDFVIVEGTINYCLSFKEIIGKHQKKCPIDLHGNFINLNNGKSPRQLTLNYLKEKTGLSFTAPQIDAQSDIRFESINYKAFKKSSGESVFSKSNAQSLDFHNVFYMHAKVLVVDEKLVNQLSTRSIARRRTYGFGNLNVFSYLE